MKRIQLLKTITTIAFAIGMVTLFFGVPFVLILILFPSQVPFTVHGVMPTALGVETGLYFLVQLGAYAFYVYALYLFKQTVILLEKQKLFHADVIKNLFQCGRAILTGWLISTVAEFAYNALVRGELRIAVTAGTFLIPALGLFFMVLGDVFRTAKPIKEENDLTV